MCLIKKFFLGRVFGVWIVLFLGYRLCPMLEKAQKYNNKLIINLESDSILIYRL
jgi:hypothetical protein